MFLLVGSDNVDICSLREIMNGRGTDGAERLHVPT